MPRRTSLLSIFLIFITKYPLAVQSFSPHGQIKRSNVRSSTRSGECDSRYARTQSLHSHIESIRCRNFGGMINGNRDQGQEDIVINLGKEANLVAITGETGSGKSLLIAKVVEYLMGCKASPTILPSADDATYAVIKVIIKLTEPHLSLSLKLMEEAGLNPDLISDTIEDDMAILQLTRMIVESETKSKSKQLKSICKVNGQLCTLKALKILVTPLIAIVDAPKAAGALSKPKARMDILDAGVDSVVLSRAREAKKEYRTQRHNRERIEEELANRVLPLSFSSATDSENIELLQHWIDEIDEFENRILSFQDSILSSGGTASLLKDEDVLDEEEESPTDNNSFAGVLRRFADCSWTQDSKTNYETVSISDSYYSAILDLRDGVKKLDDQLITAQASCDLLASLSSAESVAYALEKSRNHLFDVSAEDDSSEIAKAAEKSHDLLNQLEDALNECTKFMEDDPNGLVSTLTKARQSIHFSVEDIDEIIADWGMLSRKHGINTFSLPSLQRSLGQELDGNVEAKLELPKANAMEEEALKEFVEACIDLSNERLALASKLSLSVSDRIKSLGMEGSTFEVNLRAGSYQCNDSAAFSENSILGVDTIDFLLLHRQINTINGSIPRKHGGDEKDDERGGNLDVVGSSGEKARILLAIETDLPGSIGACCNKISLTTISSNMIAPVAVVYDEIDAHVGGRAVVSLAKLLSDQTRSSSAIVSDSGSTQRGQIISITHSASVAAVADHHVVIQKLPMNTDLDGRVEVLAKHVVGSARREELARMASGDMAPDDEGLRFADALLKQGTLHKER